MNLLTPLLLVTLFTISLGKSHKQQHRIINGWAVTRNEYQYYAFIYRNQDPYCGGTIIKENLILSAASTMAGVSPSTLRIYAGMQKLSDAQTITPQTANRIVLHPNYRSRFSDYDIAIIFLNSNITFSDRVAKIGLSQTRYPANSVVTICGFGLTNCSQKAYDPALGVTKCSGTTPSEYLRIAFMNIKDYTGADTMVTNATFIGITSCYGDFGGPVVYDNALVGVQSLIQNPDCSGDSYQASIPEVYNWITGYM